MTLWTIEEIKSALSGQIVKISTNDFHISEVIIDSRSQSSNGLFIAITGEVNDGHKFLKQAFDNGSVAALVERIPEHFEDDKRLILVKNTLTSMNDLAIFSRNRSQAKIIAITGSVGKTSIKEMLKSAFETQGKTFATKGNLNNNFGLPLTLCNFAADCEYGIFEMGMNHLGEIEPLSIIARPHIAIISNVAAAHIGNFNSEEEIALAKSEIFSGVVDGGYIILNNDNEYIDYLKSKAIEKQIDPDNIITFGKKETSDIRLSCINKINAHEAEIDVSIRNPKKQINYFINNINESSIFNSLIVVAALNIAGKDLRVGIKVFETLVTPKGRGNLIKIIKNNKTITIIDDSYNANLTSMTAGLKFLSSLKKQHPKSRAIAAIGDMLELGESAIEQHKAIAKYISEFNIDRVFLAGPLMKNLSSELVKEQFASHFQNSDELAQKIESDLRDGDILLVKGSRGMKMEKIIETLNAH